MPERIQRKRTKGWRLPENAVCVTRPSRWGNPFPADRITAAMSTLVRIEDCCHSPLANLWTMNPTAPLDAMVARRASVAMFEAACERFRQRDPIGFALWMVPLHGKDLACYCPLPAPGQPDICHAAVLLRLANE